MGEPALRCGAPRRVAGGQHLPNACLHSLPPHPGRVAGDEIESAARQYVGEVGLECEERRAAFPVQAPGRGAQLATAGPQPSEQRALVPGEPATPPEQIAILAGRNELRGPALEHRNGRSEQPFCQNAFGACQLTQRAPLGGSRETEHRASGGREPLHFDGRRDRRRRAAQ